MLPSFSRFLQLFVTLRVSNSMNTTKKLLFVCLTLVLLFFGGVHAVIASATFDHLNFYNDSGFPSKGLIACLYDPSNIPAVQNCESNVSTKATSGSKFTFYGAGPNNGVEFTTVNSYTVACGGSDVCTYLFVTPLPVDDTNSATVWSFNAPASTSTPTSTATSTDYTEHFNYLLLLSIATYSILVMYVVKVQLLKFL